MHPLILILVTFACVLGFLGFVALGLDNWSRGNRGFAVFAIALGLFCLWVMDAAMDATGAAYQQRTGANP